MRFDCTIKKNYNGNIFIVKTLEIAEVQEKKNVLHNSLPAKKKHSYKLGRKS